MFSITADFNIADVEAYMQSEMDAWFDELMDDLRARGKDFTERARAKANSFKPFNNITWNEVSSMGYCLVYKNKIIESYFPNIKPGTTGEATGAKYAKGVVFETYHTKDDVLLVLVAGMDYSAFLKAKDYDVIQTSTDKFTDEINALWQ